MQRLRRASEVPPGTNAILQAIDPSGATVGSYVVPGHDAHVRVLNPAFLKDGECVHWGGPRPGEYYSNFQWAGQAVEFSLEDEPPATGTVAKEVVHALLNHLPASSCVSVAQWEGYADTPLSRKLPWVTFPPGRRSAVWSMPIHQLSDSDRVPMRWWHPALGWSVGNDIYARSVFVSGPRSLTKALLEDPSIEAYSVLPTDPIAAEDL